MDIDKDQAVQITNDFHNLVATVSGLVTPVATLVKAIDPAQIKNILSDAEQVAAKLNRQLDAVPGILESVQGAGDYLEAFLGRLK